MMIGSRPFLGMALFGLCLLIACAQPTQRLLFFGDTRTLNCRALVREFGEPASTGTYSVATLGSASVLRGGEERAQLLAQLRSFPGDQLVGVIAWEERQGLSDVDRFVCIHDPKTGVVLRVGDKSLIYSRVLLAR